MRRLVVYESLGRASTTALSQRKRSIKTGLLRVVGTGERVARVSTLRASSKEPVERHHRHRLAGKARFLPRC